MAQLYSNTLESSPSPSQIGPPAIASGLDLMKLGTSPTPVNPPPAHTGRYPHPLRSIHPQCTQVGAVNPHPHWSIHLQRTQVGAVNPHPHWSIHLQRTQVGRVNPHPLRPIHQQQPIPSTQESSLAFTILFSPSPTHSDTVDPNTHQSIVPSPFQNMLTALIGPVHLPHLHTSPVSPSLKSKESKNKDSFELGGPTQI